MINHNILKYYESKEGSVLNNIKQTYFHLKLQNCITVLHQG